MGNYYCLDHAIHAVFHTDVYVLTYLFVGKVIFVYNLLGDEIDGYFVELILVHWIIELEVPDVHYKVFRVGGL